MVACAMAIVEDARERPRKKTRGRGLRTTTGCLTCRKRHLKCDERKPVCQQCRRKCKSCVYPDEIPSDSAENSNASSEVQNEVPTAFTGAETVTSVQTRISEPADVSSTTLEHESIATSNNELQAIPEHEGMFARHVPDFRSPQSNANSFTSPASSGLFDQPVGVAATRWLGMLAEDAEIDVDLGLLDSITLPISNSEGSNIPNTSAHFPIPNNILNTVREVQANTNEESLWRSTTLTPNQQEQWLFEFFVTDLSQWIDLFDPYRHFSTLVPRLALCNVGLLNAILALAMRRISLESHEVERAWPSSKREDALHYYHQALHYMATAMQYESYHTSLELLVTTVIISAYEMLDGSTRDWERHLQGVFWIQRSQIIHGDSGGLRGANWWAWLCQDIWAAFRDKRRVFTFWKPQKTLSELTPSQLAARSVFLLGKVVNYCAQEDTNIIHSSLASSLKTADLLTTMLDEWQSLLTPEFAPLPCRDQLSSTAFQPVWIHPSMYAVSVQIYHAARILILLKKPSLGGIDQVMQRQASLDKHVNVICGIALKLSDYASSTMSSQCLFIAGLCTHDHQRRDEIIGLLGMCHAKSGWPTKSLGEELHSYWRTSSDP